MGQQVLRFPHRSGYESLEQLAHPRVRDRESHAPHSGAHQVHAKKTGDEEVDVASALLVNLDLARSDDVATTGCRLEGVVRLPASGLGVRPRRIETVDHRVLPFDEE